MKKFLPAILAGMVFFAQCTAPKRVVTTVIPPAPEKPVVKEPVQAPEVIMANTLSLKEKAEGWQLLFDGTSSDGWHAYGSRSIGSSWKIQGDALFLDASRKEGWQSQTGGDIVTDEEFGNFELQLDWKISTNGNSGICIYVKEDKNKYPYMWNTGPEMQIVDNDGHPDGKIYKHMAGDLYDLAAGNKAAVKPPMQWNHVLIRCVNGKLDFFLNNINIVSTTLWNDDWRTLIAGSKFQSMTDFGTYRYGKIGLQDHGNNVWFRNIKIRRL